MNGFRKLQKRLTEEGWYVGWNEPCCQSCAWGCLPLTHENGTDIDLTKVLFNHSQDCEADVDGDECEACEGAGFIDDDDCEDCNGSGYAYEADGVEYDNSVSGFICLSPEQQDYSMFCFDGSDEGVQNLKAILPIIEECGCEWFWDQTGDTRIDISWSLDNEKE